MDVIDPKWETCPSDHLPIFVAFYDQIDKIKNLFKPPDDDDEDDGMSRAKRHKRDPVPSLHRPIRAG
jgi:hypothetical protein